MLRPADFNHSESLIRARFVRDSFTGTTREPIRRRIVVHMAGPTPSVAVLKLAIPVAGHGTFVSPHPKRLPFPSKRNAAGIRLET